MRARRVSAAAMSALLPERVKLRGRVDVGGVAELVQSTRAHARGGELVAEADVAAQGLGTVDQAAPRSRGPDIIRAKSA